MFLFAQLVILCVWRLYISINSRITQSITLQTDVKHIWTGLYVLLNMLKNVSNSTISNAVCLKALHINQLSYSVSSLQTDAHHIWTELCITEYVFKQVSISSISDVVSPYVSAFLYKLCNSSCVYLFIKHYKRHLEKY